MSGPANAFTAEILGTEVALIAAVVVHRVIKLLCCVREW